MMRILIVARNLFYILILSMFALSFGSCGNTRNLTYLQGQFDTAKLSQLNASEPIIRKGDILSIIVFSDNPEATKLYNQTLIISSGASTGGAAATGGITGTGTTEGMTGASPSSGGYQVDENGDIAFQGLGKLHVEGLTKESLRDTLTKSLTKFLVNPYLNIHFLNYRFTMLGEVNRPGLMTIPGEKVNLLQAIAMAGDLTFYGRRDNILIIRESNGKREFGRLDLTKPEVILSPYYYLQQNDLVYVEATNKKAQASDVVTARNISIALALISTMAIVYSLFRH
ncbi:MAG: sugar transporter [Bacteroidetes bacterium]|nr:MAG: sugar transporter [Bacteroidota bacterium]